jgi:hypothetical protein
MVLSTATPHKEGFLGAKRLLMSDICLLSTRMLYHPIALCDRRNQFSRLPRLTTSPTSLVQHARSDAVLGSKWPGRTR